MPQDQKIKSPDQLNNYIRITSPGVWIVLSAMLVLLAGFFVWLFTGQLEIIFSSKIFTSGSETYTFMTAERAAGLKKGMRVRVNQSGSAGTVSDVASEPSPYSETARALGIYDRGENLFRVSVAVSGVPQGVSEAVFVLDTVKPLSFLLK